MAELEPTEEELEEPLAVVEPIKGEEITPVERTKTSNVDDDLGVHLTKTQKTDLTDTGETSLHSHATPTIDHGDLDGLDDGDHGAIYYTETEIDNFAVKLSGAQTIYDVKTFDSLPEVGTDPSTANQLVRKSYADKGYVAGDVLYSSADITRTTANTDPTKKKEIQVFNTGTIRVKFSLWENTATGTAYGRVYKNGSGHGTQRSTTETSAVEYSEDLAFVAGDLVQIYIWHSTGGETVNVSNFRLYIAGGDKMVVNTD